MSKQNLVRSEMINAMKGKDKEKKDTLALLLAALKNAEIDKMRVLLPEEEDAVIQKEIKQTKETLEMTPADRTDIIQQCKNRLEVLQKFAPEMMTEVEIEKVISDVLNDLGLNNPTKREKGKIMKVLMPLVKGKADGKTVNCILEKKLK
ncbi:MAG TPA: GatB/YqeY domain-containing protein [Lachnospiraceae bacterium]|nr:GatB/YqeY domain-containing protein [Lachnospiraceae bacterium]